MTGILWMVYTPNDDGSWGYRLYPWIGWGDRINIERKNPKLIAHIDLSKMITKYSDEDSYHLALSTQENCMPDLKTGLCTKQTLVPPPIVYVTVLVTSTPIPTPTPASTVALRQDPIIGVWRYRSVVGTGYDNRVRFNADGTFVESFSTNELKTQVFCGVWSVPSGNSYSTFSEPGRSNTFIYDPAAKTIHIAGESNPILYLTPYNGDVAGVCVPPTPVAVEGVAQIISK